MIEPTLEEMVREQQRTNVLLAQLLEAQSADLVKLEEAARRLDISPRTIRRRMAEGVYTRHQEGRLILVSLSEIREKMKANGQ